MPILSNGHRCASVEKFAEMSHPDSVLYDSANTSYSTAIQAIRPSLGQFQNPRPPPVRQPQPVQSVPVRQPQPVQSVPVRPQTTVPSSSSRQSNAPLRSIIKSNQPQVTPPYNETVYRPTTENPLNGRKTYDRLAEVYSNSGDTAQFAGNLRSFINNNVPFFVWIALAVFEVIVGLVSIFIGAYNYSMCDVQEYIPLYLILSGSALILHGIIRAAKSIPSPKPRNPSRPRQNSLYPNLCMHGIEATILLYMLTCVILGCVWVYGYRSRYVNFMPHMFEEDYCNKTLYWIAWWSVTLHLVVFALMVLAIILIVLYGSLISED